MGTREIILEWRKGCVNTTYPGLPFWRCGHCTRAALRVMMRAALRGKF